jgi:hypothetical protein
MLKDIARITGFLILCSGFYIFITAVLGAFGKNESVNQFLLGVPKFFWDVLWPGTDGQRFVILFFWATGGLLIMASGIVVFLVNRLVPDK